MLFGGLCGIRQGLRGLAVVVEKYFVHLERDAEFVVLREHLFVLRFESSGGMTSRVAPGCVLRGADKLQGRTGAAARFDWGAGGLQAGWRDVPARIAPARRSFEQPLRPERLRAWPARVMGMEENWSVESSAASGLGRG